MDPADYSAIATLRVQSAVHLPTDSMASIKTSGLIGDKYIALSPGAEDTYLEPGNRIIMTESAVDLESLIGKVAFGSVNQDAAADADAPPADADPSATMTPAPTMP
jgi:phospholipid/cholesterol/gamma-HCH transport system substrate-binding protein